MLKYFVKRITSCKYHNAIWANWRPQKISKNSFRQYDSNLANFLIKSNEYLLFINEETICPAMYSFQLFLCYEQKKYSYCANKFQDGVYKLCHLMIVKYLWYYKFIPLFVMDTHVVAYLTCFLYSIVAVVAVTLHVWIVSIIKKVPKQNELFTN